jgi:hypothetical protein
MAEMTRVAARDVLGEAFDLGFRDAGVSAASVASGRYEPPRKTAKRIAEALNVTGRNGHLRGLRQLYALGWFHFTSMGAP